MNEESSESSISNKSIQIGPQNSNESQTKMIQSHEDSIQEFKEPKNDSKTRKIILNDFNPGKADFSDKRRAQNLENDIHEDIGLNKISFSNETSADIGLPERD